MLGGPKFENHSSVRQRGREIFPVRRRTRLRLVLSGEMWSCGSLTFFTFFFWFWLSFYSFLGSERATIFASKDSFHCGPCSMQSTPLSFKEHFTPSYGL